MIGQNIAHYRVTVKLGQGGMGEVYRATDTKLGRDVALKVLPEAFAADAQRMQRFQREAQVLASLNHPHIAAIHGLEHQDKIQALAMELVEGPTLAERIAQGAIPVEEALPIAKQIAEALEYAHEKGIVHRDLKPANVKLTAEGQVKILDFGLAKALQAEDSVSSISADFSPTLSLAATKAGIILGTAAYMAPEQARGKQVDRRADIWSFGVVLYEMLSGRRAFGGEDVSETLVSVMRDHPEWAALPASLPARVRRLMERCLTKDPRNRLRDIGEARIAIEEAIANPQADTAAPAAGRAAEVAPQPVWRRALPWAATAVFAVTTLLAFWRPWQTLVAKVPVRLSVELGADASLIASYGAGAVLSPDGMRLAFVAQATSQSPLLYVRSLDQLKASALSGTEGASSPFFSPDGQWIGFFAGSKLKKVAVQGGAVVTLCDAGDGRGGWWGEDDQIVFAATTRTPLSRVPAAGGTPQALTELDESAGENTHRWPQMLPGGKAVLFTAHTGGGSGGFDNATIVVQSLETKQRKTLHRGGSYARYLPSGHLMYMHEGTLFAAPMDLNSLELTGPPAPVVEEVVTSSGNGGAQFSFSNAGTLVYSPGQASGNGWSIYWLDSQGKVTPLRNAPALYFNPQFSPDGTRLAVEVRGSNLADVHVYDWKRDTLTRLTFGAAFDGQPVWTPDGQWISFTHEEAGQSNLYWTRSDGTGQPQRLAESKNEQDPDSWHPSGRMLAFSERNPQTDWDVMILPMEGDEKSGWKPGQPTPFLHSPFAEWGAAFSPDGRWLAYTSNESGTDEVYVRPFPSGEGKWQISTGEGSYPTWSRNGRELFYRRDNKVMVATYRVSGTSFQADKPREWSEVEIQSVGGNSNYDLHPDGKRFAILRDSELQATEKRDKVTLIENFFDELRRVAPPGGKASQ